MSKSKLPVRSGYEKRVADFLYDAGIGFVYEAPITFSDGIMVHPDFFLPKYNAFIEVWGMTGSPRYNWYRGNKRARYRREKVTLIERGPENYVNYKWFIKVRFEETLGVRFPVMRVPYYRYY